MTRILLIRHGHTELSGKVLYGRMAGIHLSETGGQEAARVAAALKERYRLDEVISSPLERAKETAEQIAAVCRVKISFDEQLQELDFGEWMGRSFAELATDEQWRLYNRARSLYGAPGGEFMMQVQLRAWQAMERAVARQGSKESTLAFVTHGDLVRALLLLFLGMPLDHIHRLEIFTASVSEVLLGHPYPQVVRVNQTF
jgi:probable phosphoglycerate mutase